MVSLSAGQDATILRQVITGQDEYGHDVYTIESIDLPSCTFQPGFSSEVINGTDQVSTDARLYPVDNTVPVFPTDQIIAPDGNTYQVIGSPMFWESPFTATPGVMEINLKLVTGGAGVR